MANINDKIQEKINSAVSSAINDTTISASSAISTVIAKGTVNDFKTIEASMQKAADKLKEQIKQSTTKENINATINQAVQKASEKASSNLSSTTITLENAQKELSDVIVNALILQTTKSYLIDYMKKDPTQLDAAKTAAEKLAAQKAYIKSVAGSFFKDNKKIFEDMGKHVQTSLEQEINRQITSVISSNVQGSLTELLKENTNKEVLNSLSLESAKQAQLEITQAISNNLNEYIGVSAINNYTNKLFGSNKYLNDVFSGPTREVLTKVSNETNTAISDALNKNIYTNKHFAEIANTYYTLKQLQDLREKINIEAIKDKLRKAAEEALERAKNQIIADITSKIQNAIGGIKI